MGSWDSQIATLSGGSSLILLISISPPSSTRVLALARMPRRIDWCRGVLLCIVFWALMSAPCSTRREMMAVRGPASTLTKLRGGPGWRSSAHSHASEAPRSVSTRSSSPPAATACNGACPPRRSALFGSALCSRNCRTVPTAP